MLEFSRTDRFNKQYKKLDPHIQQLVKKKMMKIIENPSFGKPLHAPLQHFQSERVENLRIVYVVKDSLIEFAWIDDRGHVYD